MIPDDVLFSFFKNSTACETVRTNHGSSEHCTFGFKFHNFIGNSTDDTNSDTKSRNSDPLATVPEEKRRHGAKPSDCSAGWREVDARGQGHAADIHANHDPEEEASEISSEIHPQYTKNEWRLFSFSATFEIEFVVHLTSLQFLPARFQMLSQILPIVYDATRKKW